MLWALSKIKGDILRVWKKGGKLKHFKRPRNGKYMIEGCYWCSLAFPDPGQTQPVKNRTCAIASQCLEVSGGLTSLVSHLSGVSVLCCLMSNASYILSFKNSLVSNYYTIELVICQLVIRICFIMFYNNYIQLTLEKHGFEFWGSAYMRTWFLRFETIWNNSQTA